MTNQVKGEVFDYRALRLLMGLIAFALPFVVNLLSSSPLSSISASYYTEARDAFVGMLFVVSALLWAYIGHSPKEALASKIASLAAILVAIFPTSREACVADLNSTIHSAGAITLFAMLAYFCFVPFRKNTKGKPGKKGRRSKTYFVCGCIMSLSLVSALIAKLGLPCEVEKTLNITYWAEAIALGAFGVAWIVAGKYFRVFVNENEALKLI